MQKLHATLAEQKTGLIFANLVDFDMLYGHRKDVEGFAKSLEEFDVLLAPLLKAMAPRDLLMITADHGCDPDPAWPTTDHSREYVPIVTYSPAGKRGVNLGIRDTLADMGQTIAENFGGDNPSRQEFPAANFRMNYLCWCTCFQCRLRAGFIFHKPNPHKLKHVPLNS